jgi:hypothetical protein
MVESIMKDEGGHDVEERDAKREGTRYVTISKEVGEGRDQKTPNPLPNQVNDRMVTVIMPSRKPQVCRSACDMPALQVGH